MLLHATMGSDFSTYGHDSSRRTIMNALKNILFFGLLLAVLCGVYLSLNRQPEQPLPPELARQAAPLKIEGVDGPPGLNVTTAPGASGTTLGAPPQAPTMKEWPAARSDMAPPFTAPPGSAPPSGVASSAVPPAMNTAPPFPQKDGPGDRQTGLNPGPAPVGRGEIAALPPPPSDTTSPGKDPFNYPKYPAGVSNPSAGTSSLASGTQAASPAGTGSASIAPSWNQPPTPAIGTNVGNIGPAPEEHARTTSIDAIFQQVALSANEGKLAEALMTLSSLYDNPDVPEDKAKKIVEVLDYMAAKVIYSREHLLERPYGVQPADTLESIAERYKVTPLLLARINGISDLQNLSPGKELKVLKGPFVAKVSTARGEMTMMLDGRYAGRFPVKLSADLQQASGLYHVQAKSAPSANTAAAKPQWIELGNNAGKIGIEASTASRSQNPRTLGLSEQDMDDVYGLLSVGSVLIIQR
jgi:LysM repeat protein